MMGALLNRISVDPRVMTGKPVIRDIRIAAEAILQRLYGGMSGTEILQEFPNFPREDIKVAQYYGP
jgi:uncharacterized protein (DUF433 family)